MNQKTIQKRMNRTLHGPYEGERIRRRRNNAYRYEGEEKRRCFCEKGGTEAKQ